jgi:hypothetical protein
MPPSAHFFAESVTSLKGLNLATTRILSCRVSFEARCQVASFSRDSPWLNSFAAKNSMRPVGAVVRGS